MKIKLLIVFILWLNNLHAQDPHFTQYFASPLSLNPALAGFFDGNYRLAANERSQWWNVGSAYNTFSLSADFKLVPENIPEFDTFALGFSGVFDESLNGALQSNYMAISSAYHKSLAANGKHILGVGFQVNFANRFIDYNKLSFASQFNTDYFDSTIPVNVSSVYSDTKYVEVNTGILYSMHTQNSNIYVGLSLFHGTKPKETIFNTSGNTIPLRKTAHAGGEFQLSSRSSILFSGTYILQASFKDQLVGTAYALKSDDPYVPLKVYAGFWYRVNEAYIPYLGLDYDDFNFGINYSAPVSSILSYRPNTFEVSLIYKRSSRKSALCPRF